MVGLGPVISPSRNCLLSVGFILLLGVLYSGNCWLSLYISNSRVGIVGCRSQSMVGLGLDESQSRNCLLLAGPIYIMNLKVGIVGCQWQM